MTNDFTQNTDSQSSEDSRSGIVLNVCLLAAAAALIWFLPQIISFATGA